jgi:hypothetical protein
MPLSLLLQQRVTWLPSKSLLNTVMEASEREKGSGNGKELGRRGDAYLKG